jgi:hypothetical protein
VYAGDGDGDGGGGSGFDRETGGAVDRGCVMEEFGRGGTGGGVGVSAPFAEDWRAEPNVIDRDLRNVSDSLRRRAPVEVEDATDGAGEDDDGSVGSGDITFDVCGKGESCCTGRERGVGGDRCGGAGGGGRHALLVSDPVSSSSVSDSYSLVDS